MARLNCETRMEIVPKATILFEEPGTLEAVARLAAGWFQHLALLRGHPANGALAGDGCDLLPVPAQ